MKVHIGPYRANRKIDVRIDKYDTWNMDYTLSLIVHPMLVQLKANKHGAPLVDMQDRPEHLRTEEVDEHGLDIYHFDAWNWVLDEMIWAFGLKAKESDALDACHDKCDTYGDELCQVCIKETQERMNRAFGLFGKYYEALWD